MHWIDYFINHRIWYQVSHTHRPKLEGRIIRYAILDDDDDEETPRMFDSEFTFEGHDLGTLKETLKKLTGIEEDVYICATNHVNNKLFPLKLQLPPNNLPMGIVVVKSSSKCKYSSKPWKWLHWVLCKSKYHVFELCISLYIITENYTQMPWF